MAEQTKPKEPKISIQEFYDSRNYSDSDKLVMDKLYSNKNMIVADWEKQINPKFNELT